MLFKRLGVSNAFSIYIYIFNLYFPHEFTDMYKLTGIREASAYVNNKYFKRLLWLLGGELTSGDGKELGHQRRLRQRWKNRDYVQRSKRFTYVSEVQTTGHNTCRKQRWSSDGTLHCPMWWTPPHYSWTLVLCLPTKEIIFLSIKHIQGFKHLLCTEVYYIAFYVDT